MRSLDEYDAIGLESFYATVLAICAEARELSQYESLANPVVSGVMINKLPLESFAIMTPTGWKARGVDL